jgi:hypothetical protein
MINVKLTISGGLNQDFGWKCKELSVEKERISVDEVLKLVILPDGKTLFDLIREELKIKGNYMISLNGSLLGHLEGLKKEITGNDNVANIDIVTMLNGG